jgi:hypothetical protein
MALLLFGACERAAFKSGNDPCQDLQCRPTTKIKWSGQGGRLPFDLLIVVDDRVPSSPQGAVLARTLRALSANLQEHLDLDRYAADINIGIVSSSLAALDGAAKVWPPSPACPQPDGAFLHVSELCDSPGNSAATTGDLLECAASSLQPSGQPSTPSQVIRTLLAPGGLAERTGFRRAGAYLMLAIVSSEDDPGLVGADSLGAFVEFLQSSVPEEEMLEVAVVAPAQAAGLYGLAEQLELNHLPDDIAGDPWRYMTYLGVPWEVYILGPCLPYLPSELDTGDFKPDCRVVERHHRSPVDYTESSVPACPPAEEPNGTTDGPCWRIESDMLNCLGGAGIRIVSPALACRPSYSTVYRATCTIPYQEARFREDADMHEPSGCGTEDHPAIIQVIDRFPALGATVPNKDIEEGFTLKDLPFEFIDPSYDWLLDTAGMPLQDGLNAPWTRQTKGRDVWVRRTVDRWDMPGHVELTAEQGWKTEQGCYYALIGPLLSYEVVP